MYKSCDDIINSLIAGESPTSIFLYMLNTSPEFVEFASKYYGKSTEEIAKEYNIRID